MYSTKSICLICFYLLTGLAVILVIAFGFTTVRAEEVLTDSEAAACRGADFNADNRIDAADLAVLIFYWGVTSPDYPCVDMNQDAKVDLVDFGIFVFQRTLL